VGLKRGPLSLMSTNQELLGRKSSGSGLEIREYGRRDPPCWPRGTLYPQKLALTSPTSGGRVVGIVRSRTQATEFSFLVFSFSPLLQFYGACRIVKMPRWLRSLFSDRLGFERPWNLRSIPGSSGCRGASSPGDREAREWN
jgi:hypothetical protein